MNKYIATIGLPVLFLLFLSGCGNSGERQKSPRIRKFTKVASPRNGSKIPLGEIINFNVNPSQDTVQVDSFIVKLGTRTIYNSNQKTTVPTDITKAGTQSLSYSVFLSNGKKESHSQRITFLSDIEPAQYTFRKINTYTHDPDAYTQGLYFDNGHLYESTGHRGESSLRKVEIESGAVLQKIDIDEEFFGEGITVLGDEIFMLTWESRKGFVFNRSDFKQKREFSYHTEGWGLTNIGDTLVMSDGTSKLYFIDPVSFIEIDRIQVYNQSKPVEGLNELEYVNGDIYANIYQTENIAIIDPKTGKLKGMIDLRGIFNKENYSRRLDVLNGIAYDPSEDRIFVTGKFWPKLYEIDLVTSEKPSI